MWHRFHVLMIAPALVVTAWAAGESASDRFYSAIRANDLPRRGVTIIAEGADVNIRDRLRDAAERAAVVGSPGRRRAPLSAGS